jgi:hypothetical protein
VQIGTFLAPIALHPPTPLPPPPPLPVVTVLALIVPVSSSPRLFVPEKFKETDVLVTVPLAVPLIVCPVEESVALNDPLALLPLIEPLRLTVMLVNNRVRLVTGGGSVHPSHSAAGWFTASFELDTSELASSELLVATDPETAVELLVKLALALTFSLGLLTTIVPLQFPEISGTWAKPDCEVTKANATRLKTAIRVTGRDTLLKIVRFSMRSLFLAFALLHSKEDSIRFRRR